MSKIKSHSGLVRALLLLIASSTVAASAHAQREELRKIIHQKILANGLEVIVVENHGVPLVTVEVDVKNGSFTQTADYAGLAHMYEHMFFRANARYYLPESFVARAGDLGAVYNGTTAEERVNYFLTIPADSVAEGLQFLSSALKAPLFLQDELEHERQVVIGEYDRNESSPYFQLNREMGLRLWPNNFSRKNVIGDRNVILGTTPEKMRRIQHRYYVPNNSAVIISGDVIPERAFRLVERELGDWRRGDDPFVLDPVPPIPPLLKSSEVIVEAPVGGVTVLMQWQGPSVGGDPNSTYAADVFSDVLNDPQSQFQQKLSDTGLWQGVLVNYYTLNHTGPITISGQTTPQNFRAAMKAMEREIAKFDQPGYFDADELEAEKAHRAVTSAFDRERSSGFAHTLGFWWSVASLEYYMGYVDNMAKQSENDLRSYARKYIVGKPRVTGVLLSTEARTSIKLTDAELVGGSN